MLGDDEEAAGSRAEESVVGADEKAHEDDTGPEMPFRQSSFGGDEASGEEGYEHAHGQQNNENFAQYGTVEVHGERGTRHASRKGGKKAGGSNAHDDQMIPGKGPQRGEGAEGTGEFSGAEGEVRRQAAQKHGGNGDESSASGHGIHETGKEEEQTEDENDGKGKFHGRDLIEVAGKTFVVEIPSFVEKWLFEGTFGRIRQEKEENVSGKFLPERVI